jgi:hypothetical protein
VRNALIAAGIAVASVAGVVAAIVVSSGSGGQKALPISQAASATPTATAGSTSQVHTAPPASTGSATLPSAPKVTHPVIPAEVAESDSTVSLPTTTAAIPPPPPPRSHRAHTFSVGVVDDSLAQQSPSAASAAVETSRRAGFDTVVVSAAWSRGVTRPPANVLRAIRNVAAATRSRHMRLFLVVWHGYSRNTPRDAAQRAQFATFAAETVKALPDAVAVTVGNEPNLNTFWMPQFGPAGHDVAAPAYEDLLARTYDAVKEVAPHVRVIGGAVSPRGADNPNGIRPTHSPTVFIRDLGKAYRASGRRRPLMDAFGLHPYMVAPWISPQVAHPGTAEITFADYPKLVTLLDEAFRGTHQRGRTLPIFYSEFGVQTVVPDWELDAYQPGTALDAEWGVSAATQAAFYRQALALAYCQPTVRGLFVFHTFDEPNMNGWQSGLYYADHTAKPSLQGFRRAVADLRADKLVTCAR